MFITAIHGESLIKSFTYNDIMLELVQVPDTIWCGSIAYASNLTDEPDIPGLLKKYQSLCHIPKEDRANPDWSCCISIDYWQDGAVLRGMAFAQQVLSDRQDPAHDVYRMPASLYIRAAGTKAVAQAAFGKEECELYELFGVIKEAMAAEGYVIGTSGAQEMELNDHTKYGMPDRPCYAYVQAEKK